MVPPIIFNHGCVIKCLLHGILITFVNDMKAFVFVLFAVALSMNLRDSEFLAFQKQYGKTYSAPEELRYRLAIYQNNLKKIEEHNAKNLPWTLGVNQFADISEEEFAFKFCGCAKDPKSRAGRVTPIYGDAPERVDWREKGAVTPVKNQASCGSCWAFSTVGATEGAYFVHSGKLVNLSEQQLVSCAHQPKYEALGCAGGWPWSVMDYVSEVGLCTQEAYPYEGKDSECRDSQCEIAVQSKGKVQLPQTDEKSLANAVALNPVSIVLDANSLQLYKSGIITNCGETINHAVLAVGYGEEDGIKYWIVKNSWDVTWGEKGYFRVEKDTGGMGRCGLTYSSVYPTF